MTPLMSAREVEDLIQLGFASKKPLLVIEEVAPGQVKMRLPFRESMLRPGNVVSGPTLFMAADLAMYALVLSHIGPKLMAVTSNLNINFLAKGKPGDVICTASMLKLGRRLAVMNVLMYSAAAPLVLVAQATGSYALPAD